MRAICAPRSKAFFKKSLEQLAGEREKALEQVRRRLQPVRKALEQRRFLGGDAPAYADHILFGVLQWARVVSDRARCSRRMTRWPPGSSASSISMTASGARNCRAP